MRLNLVLRGSLGTWITGHIFSSIRLEKQRSDLRRSELKYAISYQKHWENGINNVHEHQQISSRLRKRLDCEEKTKNQSIFDRHIAIRKIAGYELINSLLNTPELETSEAKKAKNDAIGEVEWESYEWDNTALNHVEARFKNNKDVVLAAVRKNGYALQYASLAFQNDKDVVLAAVSQNGFALRYASAALKNDIDVVSTAVRSRGERALEDASEALQAEFKLKKIVEVHVDNGVNSSRRWTRKYTIEDLQAESKQTVAPPDSPDVSNQNGLGPK